MCATGGAGECVIETKASVILQFFNGLSGDLHVTFEEGTTAAWLYDLLKPHVARLVVCNPRRNALLKVGNKNDRIDARKLAEQLRGNQLQPVYHGEHGLRALNLARSSGLRSKKNSGPAENLVIIRCFQHLSATTVPSD